MVLHHVLPQEHGLALPLVKIAVHREVEDVALFIVVPILIAVGGEDGVFH